MYNADGEFLFKFGSHGEGNGQFNAPTGVAVDANGNIIVADWGNSRIQVGVRPQRGVLPVGGWGSPIPVPTAHCQQGVLGRERGLWP